MDDPESSFSFAIKHQRNPDDNIWHERPPLGKDEAMKLLLKTAQNNIIQERLTTHSVR